MELENFQFLILLTEFDAFLSKFHLTLLKI